MSRPVILRLEHLTMVPDGDKQALAGAVTRIRSLQSDTDIVSAGERPAECSVVLNG